MANWLQLKGSGIFGWKTGSGPASSTLVEVSDEVLKQFIALGEDMQRDGRGGDDVPQWIGSAVVQPADTRTLVRVSADRPVNSQVGVPVILANGTDTMTITLEKMLDDATVDTGFNGQNILIELLNGGVWFLNFTNGVATKPVKTTQSGRHFLLNSNAKFKLSHAISFVAVE